MGDIKEYRKNELRDFVLVNVLMILYFSEMLEPLFESLGSQEFSTGLLYMAQVVFENAFVTAVVYVYVFIFDSLIAGDAKFKVTYFGIKGMPGETVFTELRKGMIKDNRFTMEDFLFVYSGFFKKLDSDTCTDIKAKRRYENSFWYKLYTKYASSEQKLGVAQKDYLLCRDMTMACLYLMPLYLIGCMLISDMKFSMNVVIMLVIEIFLCDVAMRSKGRRFAVDVIAIDLAKRSNEKDGSTV